MRTTLHKILVAAFCSGAMFITARSYGQVAVNDSITGTWKGSSLCQVKDSPCHDEEVVYHIFKSDNTLDYNLQMNKVVNGQEEVMGTVLFTFNPEKHELVATPKPYILWRFKLAGGKIDGTLIYKDQLYRIVKVTKTD